MQKSIEIPTSEQRPIEQVLGSLGTYAAQVGGGRRAQALPCA